MNSKSIIRSKTFWVQLIAIAASFYPPVGSWVSSNPVAAVSALGGLNILVRFVTKGQITIFPGDDSPDGGNSAGLGGPALRLLLMTATAAVLVGGLPSCATTTAPDGTKTTRPDTESITLGQQIAAWAVTVWQVEQAAKRDAEVAKAQAKGRAVVVIPQK